MPYALRALLASVTLLGLVSCCCDHDHDHDDCWWTTECYWSACCYTCYDVQYCDDYYYYGKMGVSPVDLDFQATARDAGEGRVDIQVKVTGTNADGAASLSVRLLGPAAADFRRESSKTLWAFYGIPASDVDRIEITLVGTYLRVEREIPPAAETPSFRCDPRTRLTGKAIIAPVPAGLDRGAVLAVTAPGAGEVLAGAAAMGFEVEVFEPGQGTPRPLFLRPGETTTVALDHPGRWTFRTLLLADDVCGEPSADSVVVEETAIDVR